MKYLSLSVFMLFALFACSKFDDSKIWEKLNEHESRIEKLETICNQMNTNISSIQTVVSAIQNYDYIQDIAPIMEGDKEVGYTITFAKNGSITIYYGKDGSIPIIGVKLYDGIYFWTINGEWLLDNAGNKIKVGGTDGITPKLRIEDGYWQVSYDSGNTWSTIGTATEETGQDSGVKITKDDGNVYCQFPDGTSIIIPFTELPIPYNQIWYTTTDGKAIETKDNWFSAKIQSNIYVNGKGIITFEEEPTWITELAFYKSNTLASLSIPNSVTQISEQAFFGCSNIEVFKGKFAADGGRCIIYDRTLIASAPATITDTYVIPYGIERIGESAFMGCEQLYKVYLPVGLNYIGSYAFSGCKGLYAVVCQEHDVVTEVGNTNLITSNTFSIDNCAFKDCSNLLHFPFKYVGDIGASAFRNCTELQSVYFDYTVFNIGANAFNGCTKLSEIFCPMTTPPNIGTNVFYSNASNRIIYVPSSAVGAYKTATNWSDYSSAIQGKSVW